MMTEGALFAPGAGETVYHRCVLQPERLERVFAFSAVIYRFIHPTGVVSELYVELPVKSAAAVAYVKGIMIAARLPVEVIQNIEHLVPFFQGQIIYDIRQTGI